MVESIAELWERCRDSLYAKTLMALLRAANVKRSNSKRMGPARLRGHLGAYHAARGAQERFRCRSKPGLASRWRIH